MSDAPRPAPIPAIVLAGGRGRRIAPVTGDRLPKALLPIGGRTFLDHQLDWLLAQGVRRVVLAIGFLGDQIRRRIGTSRQEMEVLYSDEGDRLLGTGGAVRRAITRSGPAARSFVVNGDTWLPISLADLERVHREGEADVTMALVRRAERGRYGAVELDASGRVRSFDEKEQSGGGWINGGVYLLEHEVLLGRDASPDAAFSLERDVLAGGCDELRILGMPVETPFCDIGLPETYRTFAAEGPG